MKKLLSFILSLTLALSLCAVSACAGSNDEGGQGVKLISGNDLVSKEPLVKWEGRYSFTESDGDLPAKVNLYHSATGFTIEFTGTELYVTFESEISGGKSSREPYYNVAVDNEVIPTVSPERTFKLTGGTEKVCIASGLENKKHVVKCLKMSEPYDAITSIISFETDGAFIKRNLDYDNANFRFMFVCASGGSGHGSLGYSDDGKGSLGRNTKNSSALHSFNYLTARMFGADVQYVGNSGWGVSYPSGQSVYDVIDYSGITTSNNVSGAKQTALWDHSKWIPDVIIFNIGGNDTVQDGFKQSVYQEEVVKLVKKLHDLYPNAYMIWTHTNSNAGKYAISALNDGGVMRAGYLKEVIIPKVGADGTVGANNHNSLATHIETANILANALTTTWGFTVIEPNVTLENYDSVLVKF
jgi:hypothetical protein